MQRLVSRLGEPVVRGAMRQAMRIMGHQFVMGRTIGDALKRASAGEGAAYRYSFDMLGEAALTAADSQRYLEAYHAGIRAIAAADRKPESIFAADSISVKLSALFPRYEFAKRERVLKELTPRILELASTRARSGVGLTVDAEEADRLQISLELFERVFRDEALSGWDGFGLAVQSYLKRGLDACRWVISLAEETGAASRAPGQGRLLGCRDQACPGKRSRQLPRVHAQGEQRRVLPGLRARAARRARPVYPQFATHNAHSVASVIHYAGDNRQFEFQRLHGMGEELYAEVIGKEFEPALPGLRAGRQPRGPAALPGAPPAGERLEHLFRQPHRRRGGAHRGHRRRPGGAGGRARGRFASAHPVAAGLFGDERHQLARPQPRGPGRAAAAGADMRRWRSRARRGRSSAGRRPGARRIRCVAPADIAAGIGEAEWASPEQALQALELAHAAQPRWDAAGAGRAPPCWSAAELFEEHRAELLALCIREGGRTLPDSVSELREAVDFLRYYAAQALREFAAPGACRGRPGRATTCRWHGRGVFLCISPWNFPLAIFTGPGRRGAGHRQQRAGQARGADAAGGGGRGAAVARCGRPGEVLHLLPGSGPELGAALLPDPRLAGVAFTGSTEVARLINRALAARDSAIATLIAETGGQNAMLVDSSALPEQVVLDTVKSAFNSAGQRCSALRVLFLQEEIADRTLRLLKGYMDELQVGDPALLSTDVGPVIDREALATLEAHVARMSQEGRVIARCRLPAGLRARHLPGAVVVRDRRHRPAGAGGLRAGPARGPLCRAGPRPDHRRRSTPPAMR
jgi:RHH-type transcriptional regulator, proline utilization regulon repressor / proline dehydrogenase / delta 1-pyrroline-5-carboxylate dehydrogenase